MLRIAVCDDQREYSSQICDMIQLWNDAPCLFDSVVFDDGDALIQAHRILPFDIILLDIVMPLLNGIETAREIRKNDKNVRIVFITSAQEYAVESYTVKASDYLLKPVCKEALFSCLSDIVNTHYTQSQMLTVRGIYAVHKLALDQIEYIEAQNKHILFVMTDGQNIETTQTLQTWEEELSGVGDFYKCHRSYIININHIKTYTTKELTMNSGFRIPISRSYQSDFKEIYFRVMFREAGG